MSSKIQLREYSMGSDVDGISYDSAQPEWQPLCAVSQLEWQ